MLVGVGLVLFTSGLSLLARLYSLPSSLDPVIGANAAGTLLVLAGIVSLACSLWPTSAQPDAGLVRAREEGPA